jgi:DmsE family decaheme c-type cytochrome
MMFSNSGIRIQTGIAGITRVETQDGLCVENNRIKRLLLAAFGAVIVMMQLPAALAEESGFIENRQCFGCHKSQKQAFQDSVHSRAFENDAVAGCQSCHGGGAAHKEVAGQDNYTGPLKILSFKKGSETPDDMTRPCLACHQKDARRSHWMGSTHQSRDVVCTSCHQIHTAQDKVRDKRDQPEVCFTCHKDRRMEINKPSHHPIPEGKMACSDCHNPHGSTGPKLMKRDSVNQTCYTCHMEKRGPFVHNHEPVTEDCSICHNPHGTTAENLLKARPPFLCHQCHTPHGGQIAQLSGQGQPLALLSPTTSGKSGINYTQGRGCLNCHTQIHGSNNPSTGTPTPQFFQR